MDNFIIGYLFFRIIEYFLNRLIKFFKNGRKIRR